MKKILSVFLAVLMLFSVLSVSSSAAQYVAATKQDALDYITDTYGSASLYDKDNNDDGLILVCYSVGDGEYITEVDALDMATNRVIETLTPGARYFQVPPSLTENYIGYTNYQLPIAKASDTETWQFNGWYCTGNKQSYVGGDVIELTPEMVSEGNCIYFTADYVRVPASSDVLETIINVLIKVFGSIVGFLFFDGVPEAGQDFLSEMISGLLADL